MSISESVWFLHSPKTSVYRTIWLILVYLLLEASAKLAIVYLTPETFPRQERLEELLAENGALWLLITGGVVAPIMEEIVFRGLLYTVLVLLFQPMVSLIRINGLRGTGYFLVQLMAITISATIFGWGHREPTWTLCLMHICFGVFAADLFRRTGTLLAPISVHIVNNVVAFTVFILMR